MEKENILKAISEVKSGSKQRKFKQSIDLAIGLKDVNLKDPAKRFRAEILLPHGLPKPVRLCVIGDEDIISKAQDAGIEHTLDEHQISDFAKNPNEAKAFIGQIDFFLAIPQLMAAVGKNLGRFLGPAGKMPTVLPPNADVSAFVSRYQRTIGIRLRQNPVIHCKVATEDMTDDQIVDNITTVLSDIEHRLDNGMLNIRSIYLKTTMGPAIKIIGV